MELTFLDSDFLPLSSPIETTLSIVWSFRAETCDTFTVLLPLTDGMTQSNPAAYSPAQLLSLAYRAVYLRTGEHCGRIETILVEDGHLRLEGRGLACMLYDRVAGAETVLEGRADQAIDHMLDLWGSDLPYIREALPVWGEVADYVMEAGENLGIWLQGLVCSLGGVLSATLSPDRTVHLHLYMGIDRSLDSAAGVNRAIFSEDFGNIATLEEETHRDEAYDRMYVQGGDGTIVTVDKEGAAENPHRRETFRKAADIRPSAYGSTTLYRAALTSRGQTLLQQTGIRTRLTCVGESDAQPRYGVDYRLGDICEIHAETLGIRRKARLTGMDLVVESGMVRMYPNFGDEMLRVKTAIGI